MGDKIFYINALNLLGRHEKIISLFEDNELNKNNPKIIENVAKSYLIQGQKDNIEEYLLKAKIIIEDILKNSPKYPKRLLKLYKKACYIFKSMLSPQKQTELKAQLLDIRSIKSSKAWLILASNYDVSNNPNLAIKFLKHAVWSNPNCITAFYKLGYIYEKNLNKIDAAIYYYKKTVLLSPEDDRFEGVKINAQYIQMACRQLGLILYERGNYKPVLLLAEKSLPLSDLAGFPSHKLIRELLHIAIKSSIKMNMREKFINRLISKYNIEEDIIYSILSFA